MRSKVGEEYISAAIDELVNMLGIKEEVPMQMILGPFRAGKVRESIEAIANYLGLPVAVNLSSGDRFESSALAATDGTGGGVEGITAQVSIPSYIPSYGALGLQNFPVSVKISDNCRRYPQTFVTVIAHELSHILLHSLRHKEKDNEFYTDLTAMILGFSNVMLYGRKVVETREKPLSTETLTTTYGYLSDEEFHFALERINQIRLKGIRLRTCLFREVTKYRGLLSSYKRELFRFNKFVKHLDRNLSKRIRREDSARIVLFHQLDYVDRFAKVIRENEERLKEIDEERVRTVYSAHLKFDSLQKLNEEANKLCCSLGEEFDLLNHDISTVSKYVGSIYKFKINRQAQREVL